MGDICIIQPDTKHTRRDAQHTHLSNRDTVYLFRPTQPPAQLRRNQTTTGYPALRPVPAGPHLCNTPGSPGQKPSTMANTYTQLYTHLVFAVKYRQALILPSFREEVEKYMTTILQEKKQKVLAIYLMPDHAHILIGQNPAIALSDTVKLIKVESTNFINEKQFIPEAFRWQEGFGAFSHSKSELDNVIKYILNQPQHHNKQSFQKEYLATLQRYDIEFKDEYLFEFFEENKNNI